MAQIVLGPNRAYPALPTVGNDLESHSRALEAIVEALQIHERRTGDLLDSFVRVRELETLGLASIDGDVVTDGGQIGAGTGDTPSHTHDYLGSLVEDLSPQLGGDLDLNGNQIVVNKTSGDTFDVYDNGNAVLLLTSASHALETHARNFYHKRAGFLNQHYVQFSWLPSDSNYRIDYQGLASLTVSGTIGQNTPLVFENFATIALGNFVFDVDQAVGATENGYALIYDDLTGLIGLEAIPTQLPDGSVTITKFADGLEPVSIVTSLPTLPDTNYPSGAVVVLTTDGLLYRNNNGTWQKVVDAADLSGEIQAAQIAAGSIELAKFATNLRPLQEVAVLPTLPDAAYPVGAVVFLTTDGKLYRNFGDAWTSAVPTVDLSGTVDLGTQVSGTLTSAFAEAGLINSNVTINADGSLSGAGGGQASLNSLPGTIQLSSYAATQRPVIIVGTLPTLPNASYPIGSTVTLTTDGKLYRNDANVWTAAVPTADLSGTINLGTQVSGTLTSAFAEAGLINANVTINADGTLSGAGGGQASLNSLTGQVSAAQIAANTITAGQIAANTITASQIAANTITASEIASNTITAGEIAANTITASQIATNTITAAEIAAGAITADELAANSITAGKMVISDWTNFYPANGEFEEPTLADNGMSGTSWSVTNAEANKGSQCAVVTASSQIKDTFSIDYIPVEPGDEFYVEGWYKTSAGASQSSGSQFYLSFVRFTDANKLNPSYNAAAIAPTIPQNAWTKVTGSFTVPAGKYFLSPGCSVRTGATAGQFYVDSMVLRRKNAGELIVDGAITANKIGANAVVAGKIDALAVTAGTIAAGVVDTAELAAGAVTAGKIEAGTITANEIATNTITANEIQAGAIGASEIAAGAITTEKLQIKARTPALNLDPFFEDGLNTWFRNNTQTQTLFAGEPEASLSTPTSGSPQGAPANNLLFTAADASGDEFFSERMTIDANKTYVVRTWANQPLGTANNYLLVAFYDSAGTLITGSGGGTTGWLALGTYNYWGISNASFPNTWTRYSFTFGPNGTGSIPTGAKSVAIGGLVIRDVASGSVYFSDYRLEEMVASTLIEDGAITTAKVSAGAIDTDQLAAGAVTAGKIEANTITAGQIAAGQITANELASTITWTKTIIVSNNGQIRGGQTAFNTGSGFYLGWDATQLDYVFSIGDGGTGDFLSWDGNELIVRGNVSIGSYTASTTEVLLAANTVRNSSSLNYQQVKAFAINKPGTIRVYFTARLSSLAGGLHTSGGVRVKRDGSVQFTQPIGSTTAQTYSVLITTTENTNNITIEYKSGERNPTEPVATPTILSLAEIRAVIDLGESVTQN